MRLHDLAQIALSNLWRTRLRTLLTTLGVIIGIGALISMVSFGTGMQKNVTSVFRENDLFTTLYVLPQKVDPDALNGDIEEAVGYLVEGPPSLNDSALIKINALPEVEMAFPEIRFPVRIRFGNKTTKITLQGLPVSMGEYKPYCDLAYGSYFDSNSGDEIILTDRALRKLNLRLRDADDFREISLEDSIKGIRSVYSDSLLGREIETATSIIDLKRMTGNPLRYLTALSNPPIREIKRKMTIVGIHTKTGSHYGGRFTGSVIVPIETAQNMPHLGFSTVWEILGRQNDPEEGYNALYVRGREIRDMEPLRAKIESMGFGIFSIMDQLQEIKRGFLILDTALGAVGTIALIVAALGIINTMVMSILERTREIGIMKAIGGSETEIKTIFLIESGCIGILGGLFGIILGWIVSRIANLVANLYLSNEGIHNIDFFYIPFWLILGAIAFSILVSLIAGLYPAKRAARVDPVKALRHD